MKKVQYVQIDRGKSQKILEEIFKVLMDNGLQVNQMMGALIVYTILFVKTVHYTKEDAIKMLKAEVDRLYDGKEIDPIMPN